MIFDPGEVNQTIGNQVVVLPNGTVIDGFDLIENFANTHKVRGLNVAFIRSGDKGATWSSATIVDKLRSVGVVDPDTGQDVRTGDIIPSWAVDPATGTIYVVWQDSRFNGGAHDDVVLSKSTNGGQTWSAPVRVSQAPNVASFTPTVAVTNGVVAVTYYDFRNNTPDPNTLPTDYWIVHSHDGGATWTENHVAGPFDMKLAPFAEGYFVGDYEGLGAAGGTFYPFYSAANSTANPTDIFATSAG
jgi:Neuraminidase (sialidase)